MAKTLLEEKQDHIQAFVKTFWSAQTEELRTARKLLARLNSKDAVILVNAIAQFTISDVYYDQVLQGPVPGQVKPEAGQEPSEPGLLITEQGRQLLHSLRAPKYVATTQVALAFTLLKYSFRSRLSNPVEWREFYRCLYAYELLFDDPAVQLQMQRKSRRGGTVAARFLAVLRWMQEQQFAELAEIERQLRLMPMPLLDRFVLFLEDYQDGHLLAPLSNEHTTVPELAGRAWWQQLVEFIEARHPLPE